MRRRDAETIDIPEIKTTMFNSNISRIDQLKGRIENGNFIHNSVSGNRSFACNQTGKESLHSPSKNGNFLCSPNKHRNFVGDSIRNGVPTIPGPISGIRNSLHNPSRDGNFKTATYQCRKFENSYRIPFSNGLLNENASCRESSIKTHVTDIVKSKLAHIINSKSSKLKSQFEKNNPPIYQKSFFETLNGDNRQSSVDKDNSSQPDLIIIQDQSQNICEKPSKVHINTISNFCSNNKSKCTCNAACTSQCSLVNNSNPNLVHVGDKLILNRKHVKLKGSKEPVILGHSNSFNTVPENIQEEFVDDEPEVEFYVLESSRRLAYFQYGFKDQKHTEFAVRKNALLLENIELEINILFEKDIQMLTCHPKNMRSSPKERNILKSTSSEDSADESSGSVFRCEWFQCNRMYSTIDKFTKHVKKEHIQPSSKNDVFVCLWNKCRFSNQPSCSYKWLLKHVLRHCDLKPFKCVIFGCDMAFVTQSGLARHVPTHFNEGNVRRTCVRTNTSEASLHWESPTTKKNLSLKLNSVADANENSRESTLEDSNAHTHFHRFVGKHKSISSAKDSFTPRMYDQLKRRIEQSSCSPVTNHGYVGKLLRVDHKVVGRRTLLNGDHDMLLSPSLDRVFPHKSMWLDASLFRQHKTTFIDLPFSSLSSDAKNNLYDFEHASNRRKRKRK